METDLSLRDLIELFRGYTLEKNALKAAELLGLEHYREVAIFDFQFGSKKWVVVDKDKLKTAAFLQCLSKVAQHAKTYQILVFGGTRIGTIVTFNFVEDMREAVEEYYVRQFCEKVCDDPRTTHTSLKELLSFENSTQISFRVIKLEELDHTLCHLEKQEKIENLCKFDPPLVAEIKQFGTVFYERGTIPELHPFLKPKPKESPIG